MSLWLVYRYNNEFMVNVQVNNECMVSVQVNNECMVSVRLFYIPTS